jgi:hypothetical protein
LPRLGRRVLAEQCKQRLRRGYSNDIVKILEQADMGMSEDFIFAVLMLVFGLAILAIAAYAANQRKIYFNPADNSVMTEIEIPVVGKIKSNVPYIVLCFIGLVPVILASNAMKSRNPNLVKFQGEVVIDPSVTDVNTVTVGITSSLWSDTSTPGAGAPISVGIAVPDSWPSYSAYAFAFGATKTRPAIIGANLSDPKFKLRIVP